MYNVQTHFGFINSGSKVNTFWVLGFWKVKKVSGTPCTFHSGDGIVFSRIEIVHSDRVLSVIGLSCFQSGELKFTTMYSVWHLVMQFYGKIILAIFSNSLEVKNFRSCPGDFTKNSTTRARIILLSKFLPGWSTTRARIIFPSKFLPGWYFYVKSKLWQFMQIRRQFHEEILIKIQIIGVITRNFAKLKQIHEKINWNSRSN